MLTTYKSSTTTRVQSSPRDATSTIELEGGLNDALGHMRSVELRAMEALRANDAKTRELLVQREMEVERLRNELNAINAESGARAQEQERLINELTQTNRALFEAQERRHEYQQQVDGLKEDNTRLTTDLSNALSRMTSMEQHQRTSVYELEKVAKERNEAIARARAAEARVQQLLEEKANAEMLLRESMESSAKGKQRDIDTNDLERKFQAEKAELQQQLDKALWKLENANGSVSSQLALKDQELTRLRIEFDQFKTDVQRERDLIRLYRDSHEALKTRVHDIDLEDPASSSSSTTTTKTTYITSTA